MNWFRKTVLSPRFWLGENKFSSSNSTLTVTVVIPAWNEESCIADTIKSVLAQDYPVKVVVVNDRSTDNTSSIAHSFKGVTVIDVTEKAGSKSQALNKAISYVDTNIFICVDADTILEKGSVRKLIKAFNNPNIMIASGFVVAREGNNFWQAARSGEYIIGQSVVKCAQENMNTVLVASGCFFAIRTRFLKQTGFDDRTLAEDMDLTWTAIEDGYDIAFVRNARCSVEDPDTWYLYHKQLYRWYAGMFQCIKQRKFNLFSKNPKLGISVYFYILFELISTPLTLIFLIIGFYLSTPVTILSLIFIYIILLIIAVLHGINNKQKIGKYPRYVFCMMFIGFINYAILLKSLFNELILNRNLKVWVKGH